MKVEYNFHMKSKDGIILSSKGEVDINADKIKDVERKCFEWGYSITDLIQFFIQNLSPESAEQLLSTMQQYE